MKPFWKCKGAGEVKKLLDTPHDVSLIVVNDGGMGFDFTTRRGQVVDVFQVLAGWSDGWDHANVAHAYRWPTWDEMDAVRRMLWKPGETVIQCHPPYNEVKLREFYLTMWRKQGARLQVPYSIAFGIEVLKGKGK
jgi:hypothetical protein